tara:strand:- start:2461 stop:2610 length:150 start_codon:yes stop_codon:yes gene_type:complete
MKRTLGFDPPKTGMQMKHRQKKAKIEFGETEWRKPRRDGVIFKVMNKPE